jgi:hypothetical protein
VNEPQLISELRAALDDAARPVRAPAGFAERARKRALRRRLGRGLAAVVPTAGLAAGLVIAVSAPPAPHSPGAARARQSAAGPGAVRPAQLTALQGFHHAAAAALARPAVVPRADQFIYQETVDLSAGTTQAWRSVDGSRTGFVVSEGNKTMLPGCRDGWQTIKPDPGSGLKSLTQRCVAQPAYLKSAPATASQMQAYLVKTFGSGLSDPAVAEKATEFVLSQCYLMPAQQAALFRFFATLPGLKVIAHFRDYAGRQGIGVSLSSGGSATIWIFDPRTFAFLGSTYRLDGKVLDSSAVLKVAIVDQAGQHP